MRGKVLNEEGPMRSDSEEGITQYCLPKKGMQNIANFLQSTVSLDTGICTKHQIWTLSFLQQIFLQ